MEEIWKDIKNYEGIYQISNFGRVKNIKKQKILKPLITNKYCKVVLCKNGIVSNQLIHRLVAIHFLPNLHNFKEVNHKDENPLNNCLSNLEWCDRKYNINYGTANLRRSLKEKGIKKIVDYKKRQKKVLQYDLEGNFIKEWESISSASKCLKIHKIWEVCNNKRHKAGNYYWRYKEEVQCT